MLVNKEYFKNSELRFRGISRETDNFITFFEEYAIKSTKFECKFEDFMATLGTHLNKKGYSIRKIEKWYKKINKNIQDLAKEVLIKKNEK